MPHKKYFYAMQEYTSATVITIDDDLYLPLNLIKKFKEIHLQFPKVILCPIAMEIKINKTTLLPYEQWPYMLTNKKLDFGGLPIGACAVLYQPNSLHTDVFEQYSIFNICLRTDDLWLKIMSLLQKTKILILAGQFPRFYIPIIFKNNIKLMDENVFNGKNDENLKSLMDYYKISVLDFKLNTFIFFQNNLTNRLL